MSDNMAAYYTIYFQYIAGGKLGMNEFEIGWSKPNVSTLQMCYKVFRNYACFVTEFVAVKSQELDYSWALPWCVVIAIPCSLLQKDL